MKPLFPSAVVVLLSCILPAAAQNPAPAAQTKNPSTPQPSLRITSRAVLVDVVVTDRNGNPVSGLNKDVFRLAEDGKPQTISFFEEHRGLTAAQRAHLEFPKLPDDTFTNFSPIATPPAVNVLLIDALNTPMADQMYLREAAKRYLKSVKPGSRIAIFTMGLRLHFVEGFSDDPTMLAKALGYKKNNRPDPTVLVQSQEEAVAEDAVIGLMNRQVGAGAGATTSAAPAAMIQSFQQFLGETQYAQTSDREYRTMSHLQQLAAYLGSFPGRKNLIWLSGAFPLDLFGLTGMRFDDEIMKTVNVLAAARVAIYPVDARGLWVHSVNTAGKTIEPVVGSTSQLIGPATGYPPVASDPSTMITGASSVTTSTGSFTNSVNTENLKNNVSDTSMEMLATDTGGKAFYNQNDLTGIISKVVGNSSSFYTLSYAPTDSKMDGSFRKISVDIPGARYVLSYRRGYFAREDAMPGAAQDAQTRAIQHVTESRGADPLQPFMDFGLPRSQQILYKLRVLPSAAKPPSSPAVKINGPRPYHHYAVDFAIDRNDLELPLDPADGLHKGTITISLIVYDKYGEIATRKEYMVGLNLKPDVWNVFEQTGVQLHAELDVPNGQYWLRTGVYDQSTRKVGTMELPLAAVHPLNTAVQQAQAPAQPQ